MAEPQPRNQNLNNLDQTPVFETDDDITGDPSSSALATADPSSSAVATGDEDLDFIHRPSKRRKNCPSARRKNFPSALDRLQDLTPNPNRSFSFTFDTNSGGFSPEITPKFGSFDPGQWEMEGQKLGGEIREKEAEKDVEEDEEEKKEDDDEGEGVGIGDLASAIVT